MAKGKSVTSRNTTNKRNSPSNTSGRPRPMAPKAGVTKQRSRYEKGGKWCW